MKDDNKSIMMQTPELGFIIDIPSLQALLDDFFALTNMAVAILDIKGRVLVASGWQDICTRFHRIHPQTARNCTEGDLFLSSNVQQGKFVAYKCKNQMWDVVTPLYVAGKHVGNIYTGQFFYDDETIDEEAFIAQAARYGFDRESYLRALHGVPCVSRDRVDAVMSFLTKLSVFVSEMGYHNQELAQSISEQQRMARALRESENLLRATFNATADGILVVDKEGSIVQSNSQFAAMWRIPRDLLDTRDDEKTIAFILGQLEDPEGFQSKVRELYQSSRECRDEVRFKDGRVYERFSCPVISEGSEVGRIWDFRDITEGKMADEALRKSQQEYRNLFENAMVGMYRSRLDGSAMLEVNQAFCDLFGYTREEILSKPATLCWADPKSREGMVELLSKNGTVTNYGMDFITKNGEIRHSLLSAKLYPQEGFMEGTMIDITERKQAEEALKVSNERLSLALEVGNAGVWEWNLKNNAVRFDDRFHSILGYAPGELPNTLEKWLTYHHPGDLSVFMPKAEAYLRGDSPLYESEHRIRNKNGTWTWIFTRGQLVNLATAGPAEHFIGIAMNITERKRTVEELEKQHDLLTQLVETSPVGIIFVDRDGKIILANNQAEEILCLSKTDIKRRDDHAPAWRITDPVGEPFTREDLPFMDVLAAGKPVRDMQQAIERPDGRRVLLSINGAPLISATGEFSGMVAAFEDITERKRNEEEREKIEKRLQQSYKMEAIGTLAGGIAHDFNNILSSVLGFTELAKFKAEQGDDVTNELDAVLTAAIRARDLVKQILMFSRQAEIKREPMDIAPLIKETLKFLRASLPATIEFRQNLAVSGCLVMADPVQIHQVLMNLCTNAAHAMKEKGGLLDISLTEMELTDAAELEFKGLKRGRYLRLSVADTGCGIPKEIINRIFDPFFTTKARGEGTGMGLSVVHGIVKDMEGDMSVYSEPGRGTTFNILLPLYGGATVEPRDRNPLMKAGRGSILFVDDEEGVIVSGRGILERLGYKITATASPGEALALFTSQPEAFDLVLTDLTMPGMTGLVLAEKIRSIRPDIPIVLCTGFSLGISPERIREAGIREMVMKPLAASELSEAVHRTLNPADG